MTTNRPISPPQPELAVGCTLERIVEGSRFHTVNGLAFGPDGQLYLASVMSESIFTLDLTSLAVDVAVAPPGGDSDDVVFTPAGDLIWTAILEGSVRMKTSGGDVLDLANDLPGANGIALTRDRQRLFVGQVFMGDGLWEVDLAGSAPARLVTGDTGGLNAFQFGPDDLLYAPSWERGQVVRVDPQDGRTEVLAEGFTKPGAVRFDADDQLYLLDDASGELFALHRSQDDAWTRRLITRLASATDNMAIGPDGLIYVTNMADNAVLSVDPRTGATRTLLAGRLGFPRSLALSSGPAGDLLHVADSCAYRVVDPAQGTVRDVARAVETELKFPTSVSVGPRHVLLTGEIFGVIQVLDLEGHFVGDIEGFDHPGDAIELEDGRLLVVEPAAGRLLEVAGEQRRTVAGGLDFPTGLARSDDRTVFLAESGTGRLLRVDLAEGSLTTIVEGLGRPGAIAAMPDGSVAVLDVRDGRLLVVDPVRRQWTQLVSGLPVGYLQVPYPRSGGVAVGSDGTLYIAADQENAIYRLTRSVSTSSEPESGRVAS